MMVANAQALARSLTALGVPVFAADRGATLGHQFAVIAAEVTAWRRRFRGIHFTA